MTQMDDARALTVKAVIAAIEKTGTMGPFTPGLLEKDYGGAKAAYVGKVFKAVPKVDTDKYLIEYTDAGVMVSPLKMEALNNAIDQFVEPATPAVPEIVLTPQDVLREKMAKSREVIAQERVALDKRELALALIEKYVGDGEDVGILSQLIGEIEPSLPQEAPVSRPRRGRRPAGSTPVSEEERKRAAAEYQRAWRQKKNLEAGKPAVGRPGRPPSK